MKALFNIQGHQLEVNLFGESWRSDETIKGELFLRKTEKEANNISISVASCDIDLKKLKKKDAKTFKVLNTLDLQEGIEKYDLEINPNIRQGSLPISDGATSLGLLIGDLSDPFSCAQLQLQIAPRQIIEQCLSLFQSFKRCSVKSVKNKNSDIEVKLATPSTGEMAQIDTLAIIFSFQDKELKLTYQFRVKKLIVGAAGVETKKEKLNIIQSLQEEDYLSFGQLNQDKFIKKIDEALCSIKGIV